MRTFASRRWLAQYALVTGAILSVPVAPVAAQATDSSALPRVSLFTKDDAYLGAFFIVGTLALRPFDKRVAGDLQRPGSQANRLFQDLSTGVRVIAVPGAVIIGTTMYAVGRLAHGDRLADLGLHGLEALGVGDVVNTAIKWSVGRARPYVVGDTNPSDYEFMRGYKKGRDYSSFPSGHVLAAFAAAAAVSNETARWWPGSQWYVGPAMFGGAAAVALSRLYNNQHWASDVIMAAGIGTFAGNKVVRFNHRTSPHNKLDHLLLSASLAPATGGGIALTWTLLPR